MLVVVHALVPALVTRHRAVGQHPARVLLALVDAGPVGAVLVAVHAAGLHPGLGSGRLGGGGGCGATADLGIAPALVQGVDLADVCVGEAVPLAQLALGGVLRYNCLLSPGLGKKHIKTVLYVLSLSSSPPQCLGTLANAVEP